MVQNFEILTHNVWGNQVPLPKIWTEGELEQETTENARIVCLQEVHETDLYQLLRKNQAKISKGQNFAETASHLFFWAPNFQQSIKRSLRDGLLYLLTIVPREKFCFGGTINEPGPIQNIYRFCTRFSDNIWAKVLHRLTGFHESFISALAINLEIPQGPNLSVINTHLPAITSPSNRALTLDSIMRKLYKLCSTTIIAGDFNPLFTIPLLSTEERDLYTTLKSNGFQCPFLLHRPTFGSIKPSRLDLIGLRSTDNNSAIVNYTVESNSRGSDHLPVRAIINYQTRTTPKSSNS